MMQSVPVEKIGTDMMPEGPAEAIETNIELRPSKRLWSRMFKNPFKRKRPNSPVRSSQTVGEKLSSTATTGNSSSQRKEDALVATRNSGEDETSEGILRAPSSSSEPQIRDRKLQATQNSGQGVENLKLDEHNINGLRSGGGKFMPCFPATFSNRNNVHSMFFSTNHDIEPEIPHVDVMLSVEDGKQNPGMGCLPKSPKLWTEVSEGSNPTAHRGKNSKLLRNWRQKRISRTRAHHHKTEKGCFPQLGKCREPEDPKGTRFTYLHLDEDGNYVEMSEDGSTESHDWTHLEFKEGKFKPKVQVLQDEEMTYLELDKEGKYESSAEVIPGDVIGTSGNGTESQLTDGFKSSKRGLSRVYPRSSVITLLGDDIGSDLFHNLGQPIDHGSFSTIVSREGEPKDFSTHHEIKVKEKSGLTNTESKERLPTAKPGYRKYFFPTKEGTLESTDSVGKKDDKSITESVLNVRPELSQNESKTQRSEKDNVKVRKRCLGFQPQNKMVQKPTFDNEVNDPSSLPQDEASKTQLKEKDGLLRNTCLGRQPKSKIILTSANNNQLNDSPNLLQDEVSETQQGQDGGRLRNRCLGLQLGKEQIQKSAINGMLNDPPDLLQHQGSKTEQKEEDSRLQNRCLGLQPLKYSSKNPVGSTGLEKMGTLEDITHDEYNFAELDDPWKGEEVGEFELRDFKKLKSKKMRIPFCHKAKRDIPKTISAPSVTNYNNDDGGNTVDNVLQDTQEDTQWEDSNGPTLKKGCLPFSLRSKTNHPLESDEEVDGEVDEEIDGEVDGELDDKLDKDGPSDELEFGEFEMDFTGDMVISIDSDDESDCMESFELDNCSVSNRIIENPREDGHNGKSRTKCLPFGRIVKTSTHSLETPSTGSEESLHRRIIMQSTDLNSLKAEVPEANSDDSNANMPQKWCLPLGRNEKKDPLEAHLISSKPNNTQIQDPQIEEDESQRDESGGLNVKKTCLPFGRQKTAYSEAVAAFENATNPLDRINMEVNDQKKYGRREEDSEFQPLSEWQEQSSIEEEIGWFPSNCFSKQPAKSAFWGPTKSDPNQVRVDLELRNTEMHSCLPFARKSRQGKLIYTQSGLTNASNFQFELDLQNPLMEGGDQTYGDEDQLLTSTNRCLPLGLMSRKQNIVESSTHVDYDEMGNVSIEPQERELASEKKFSCADHIFPLKKHKPTHVQELSDPQHKTDLSNISAMRTSPAEENVHEVANAGCHRFSRKHNVKKALESPNPEPTLPSSGPVSEKGYCIQFNKKSKGNTNSMLEGGEDESSRTLCGGWSNKRGLQQQTTSTVDLLSETSNSGKLTMQDPIIHTEESRDDSNKTSCGRFWIKNEPQGQIEESVNQAGNTTCSKFWMKQDPEKQVDRCIDQPGKPNCNKFWMTQLPPNDPQQSTDQSSKRDCGKLWIKEDPQKSVTESLESSERSSWSSCSRLSMRKGPMNSVEVDADESRRISCGKFVNRPSILKELEDTIDESKKNGKSAVTKDEMKQLGQVVKRSGGASCNDLRLRQALTKGLQVVVDESGKTTCGKFLKNTISRKQLIEEIRKRGRTSCNGLSLRRNSRTQLEVMDESGSKVLEEHDARKKIDEAVNKRGRTSCNGLLLRQRNQLEVVDESGRKVLEEQDARKEIDEAVNKRPSYSDLSLRRNSRSQLEVDVDESGRKVLEEQDARKKTDKAVNKRPSCSDLSLRRNSRSQLEAKVDESGSKVLEEQAARQKTDKAVNKRPSCSDLSLRRNSRSQLDVAVDESGSKVLEEQDALKKIDKALNKRTSCSGLPLRRNPKNQLEVEVDESGSELQKQKDGGKQIDKAVNKRPSCSGLPLRRNSRSQLEAKVDKSGRQLFEEENVRKQIDEAVKKRGRTGCNGLPLRQNSRHQLEVVDGYESKVLEEQDASKLIDEPINKWTGCNGFSLRKNPIDQHEVKVDESGRTTCGKVLRKQDARNQSDEAVNEPQTTSCSGLLRYQSATKQPEEVVDEIEKTACGRFLTKPNSTKQCDKAVDKPGRSSWAWLSLKKNPREQSAEDEKPGIASCGKIFIKQDDKSPFNLEVNESNGTKNCVWFPLKQGETKQLEEGLDDSGKMSCGGSPLRKSLQRQSEVVVQKPGTIRCGDLFSFKGDPPKEAESGEMVDNSQPRLTEFAQRKTSILLNQKREANHVNEDEVTRVKVNAGGDRSRKWFLTRYCICMDVSDNSSTGSKYNFEAPVIEESINKIPELNTIRLEKSEVGRAQVREIAPTPDGRENSGICSHRSCPIGQKGNGATAEGGCAIYPMNPFGMCALQTRDDGHLGSAVTSELYPTSQQPNIDEKEQHTKAPTHRSDRVTWNPCLDEDPKPGVLKPCNCPKAPTPPTPEIEYKSNEQDGYPRYLEEEPESGMFRPSDSRKGLEHSVPLPEPQADEHDRYLRLFPEGEPSNHSCNTFSSHTRADISASESSTARKGFGESYKDCGNFDSAKLQPYSDGSIEKRNGDTWSQMEFCMAETYQLQGFPQQYPENKWLRREGREPLAEDASALTDQCQHDWLQDDNDTTATQESTPSIKSLHDERSWQQGPLAKDQPTYTEKYLEKAWEAEKEFTPQNSTDLQDSRREYCWERNHKPVTENEGFKEKVSSAPLQHELREVESQGIVVPHPEDGTAVAEFPSQTYEYKGMEVGPNILAYDSTYNQLESNPEDEELYRDQKPSDSNQQTLRENWQNRQQESVAESLEASETLLKKLIPIRLPESESSGQNESSSSGLSKTMGPCCLMPMFTTEERRKPKRTHTKDVEIQATTCCGGLGNQQTNEQISNPEFDSYQMIVASEQTSQRTFQQENQQRKKQRTTLTRRVRGSSTPVGGVERAHRKSSRKVLEAEHSSPKSPAFGSATKKKKNKLFHEVKNDSEELIDFKEHRSQTGQSGVEVPAAFASHNINVTYFDKPPKHLVDSDEQERPSHSLAAGPIEVRTDNASSKSEIHNCNKDIRYNKPPCRQNFRLDPNKTKKKVPYRSACAPKCLTSTSWECQEDSDGVEHQAPSVSVVSKTHGRKPNTSNNVSKRIAHLGLSTSATDDSTSDDDIYDIASKDFRDNLFKNNHRRDSSLVTESVVCSQAISFTNGGKNYQKTAKKEHFLKGPAGTLRPLLQNLESSDKFTRSPVFRELVKVESQMKDIAKIIVGLAGPDYLKAVDHSVYPDEADSPEELNSEAGQVSVYSNPIWFSQWKEPISVQMATRLAEDEVPIYYDDGFKIGYMPVEYRGNKGMRKSKQVEELDEEYSKFMNQKIKPPPSDDDDSVYQENGTRRHPRKRFSQKFTSKKLLHEKLHPHDHRSSRIVMEVPVSPVSSSSSSNWSWKEDLIQSHRKVFLKDQEVMGVRKKSVLNGDTDSDDSFPSPRYEGPSIFMEQVDDELARLKFAKMQLQEGLQEPMSGAAVSHKLKGNCNKKKGCSRAATHSDEDADEDSQSDFSKVRPLRQFQGKHVRNSTEHDEMECSRKGTPYLGWTKSAKNSTDCPIDDSSNCRQRFERNACVQNSTEIAEDDSPRDAQCLGWMGRCMSPGKSQEGSPSKARRALENKEFQLLERRVRKELGEKQNMKPAEPARHPLKEEMTELSEQVSDLRSEHATKLDESHSNGTCNTDVELDPASAESNQESRCGKSSSVHDLHGPVSSLVKLMFGTRKNDGKEESAKKVRAAEAVIQKKVGALEAEITIFQENNRRLRVIMKENAEHMSRLMRERGAWELQKNSDMEAFRQYTEAQMNKLQQEKYKMEHQSRALKQIPTKEERKEIEELKAKLAEERDTHHKKEQQWRQTSSRIRGVNDGLKKQIHELRKEVRCHEDRLFLDPMHEDLEGDNNTKHPRQKAQRIVNTIACTRTTTVSIP